MENDKKKEAQYITFDLLRESIGLTDNYLFITYLKEIYNDLVSRNDKALKNNGIQKNTFYDYIKLPIFISEKLFGALDQDNDGFLSSKEFVDGLNDLYMGSFEQTLKIIFNILDFDKDGKITKEDVQILLSYLPLKNTKIQYKNQLDSLKEIDDIISKTFENKKILTLNDFRNSVENLKSDVYLQILCFLYLQKPFNSEAVDTLRASRKRSQTMKGKRIPLPEDKFKSPITKDSNVSDSNQNNQDSGNTNRGSINSSNSKMLICPDKRSSLSPVISFLKATSNTSLSPQIPKKTVTSFSISGSKDNNLIESSPIRSGKGMLRLYNEKISGKNNNGDLQETIEKSKNVFQSPSAFLLNSKTKNTVSKTKDGKEIEQIQIGNKIMPFEKLNLDISDEEDEDEDEEEDDEDEDDDSEDNKEKDKGKNNEIEGMNKYSPSTDINKVITYENWIYKISPTNQEQIKKYYLVVINKDLFYYKTNTKEELIGMHNLTGSFIKDTTEKVINGTKYYTFQVIFKNVIKDYYTTDKDIANKFVDTLKSSIGYLNFFDYYEMVNDLGEGKFGKVKLGIHKRTNQQVAIKIIKKSEMSSKDGELINSEIDIMKLCHHPNIIHLLDHFENSEYIFIVMEYLQGGNLDSYLRKQKVLFTENKAANIIQQIASGIQYLHKYGIVHRDLKPENIMLTESNDHGIVKIMDFGLSKIMGPSEKASDGFGTLNFVAPEVLLRTPYNKSIDIWSIGIILYYILSGRLPFDDPEDNEEKIAKFTVFKEVEFPKKLWANRSNFVIDLIKKCLAKDPTKRIDIDEFLNHQWFEYTLGKNKNKDDKKKKK